jgi:hypothetical protein
MLAIALLLIPLALSDGTIGSNRLASLMSLEELESASGPPQGGASSGPFHHFFAHTGNAFAPHLPNTGLAGSGALHDSTVPDTPMPMFATALNVSSPASPAAMQPPRDDDTVPRPTTPDPDHDAFVPLLAITGGGGIAAPGNGGTSPIIPPTGPGTGPVTPPTPPGSSPTDAGPGTPTTPPGGGVIVTPLPGVPEPATWATMILGLFGTGALLRRRVKLRLATAPACAASPRPAG